MRFGKKRDLSFCRTKEAAQAPDKNKIKVTDNPDKPVPRTSPRSRLSPTSRSSTRRSRTSRSRMIDGGDGGDPNGVRAAPQPEASGDPYIQAIMAAVVSRWTVPTMLLAGELAAAGGRPVLRSTTMGD